jgi:PKD repeat protein
MKYSTNSAPNETRTGYFMLTATNATPRNLGDITGFSLFYEGDPIAAAEEEQQTTATNSTSSSLSPTLEASSSSPPSAVGQVFGSFELIAGEETVGDILAALAAQAEQADQAEQQPAQQQQEAPSPLSGELVSNATRGVAPATFEFEANIEGGVEPYTINWDFDDGSEEEDEDSVVHTYDEAGTYSVTASVTDSVGQAASAGMEITVEEPSPAEEAEDIICDSSNTVLCNPPSSESEANQPDSDEPTNNADEPTNNADDIIDLLNSRLDTNSNPSQP